MENFRPRPDNDPVGEVFGGHDALKKLLEVLPPEDLLVMRLVNRNLNAVATEVIALTGSPAVRPLKKDAEVSAFLERMKNPERPEPRIPFSSFDLSLTLSLPTITNFLDSVPKLTNLKLSFGFPWKKDGEPWKPKTLKKHQIALKVMTILSAAPNLELLILAFDNFLLGESEASGLPPRFPKLRGVNIAELGTFGQSRTTLLGQLLGRAPRLDYLCVRAGSSKEDDFKGPALAQVPQLLLGHDPPPMLGLHAKLIPENVAALTELVTQRYNRLTHFFVDLAPFLRRGGEMPPGPIGLPEFTRLVVTLNVLLSLQTESLETLIISMSGCTSWRSGSQLVVPELRGLRSLSVVGFKCICCGMNPTELCPIRPLTPNQFPELKELKFRSNWIGLGLIRNCVLPSLESFHFEGENGEGDRLEFWKMFPGLKNLNLRNIPPWDQVKDILWEMKNLESLDLGHHAGSRQRGTDDEGFWTAYTGGIEKRISKDDLVKMWTQRETLQLGLTAGEGGSYPGLANLKKLRRLSLPIWTKSELYAILFLFIHGKFQDFESITIRNQIKEKLEPEVQKMLKNLPPIFEIESVKSY